MPFTLAHPAAVLPLLRKENSFNQSALILGSMAPDFEYYIHFRPIANFGHSIWGQLSVNLPLTLLLALWFHLLVRPLLLRYLPDFILKRINPSEGSKEKWKTFKVIAFLYSALLGMMTHLLWDSFTHKSADLLILLTPFSFGAFQVPLYSILQHGSSLMGAFFISLYFLRSQTYKLQASQYVPGKTKRLFWSLFILLSFMILILIIRFSPSLSLVRVVIALINASIISISLLSLIPYFRRQKPVSNKEADRNNQWKDKPLEYNR